MWVVAGLGNPGARYISTRHNVGFMALDAYALSVGGPKWREDHQCMVVKLRLEANAQADEPVEVLLAKPNTYMNNSGKALRFLMDFYKLEINKLIVLHDDIDIGFGGVKVHRNRGPGGHNGLKDINEVFGTQDYVRIKLGVGRPTHVGMDVADYVLQSFSTNEQAHLRDFLSLAGDAFESVIFDGYDKAATRHTRAPVDLA